MFEKTSGMPPRGNQPKFGTVLDRIKGRTLRVDMPFIPGSMEKVVEALASSLRSNFPLLSSSKAEHHLQNSHGIIATSDMSSVTWTWPASLSAEDIISVLAVGRYAYFYYTSSIRKFFPTESENLKFYMETIFLAWTTNGYQPQILPLWCEPSSIIPETSTSGED